MKKVALLIISVLCFAPFVQAQQQQEKQEKERRVQVRTARPDVERRVGEIRERMGGIPNLTQEQRDQMKTLRVEMMKESNTVRNQIAEKRAHLKSLQATDNADMKAINKTIDEIASLQAQQMKAQANMQVKTRALLTDEQKVMYDARGNNMRFNFNTSGRKFNFDGDNKQFKVRAFKFGDTDMPNSEEINKIVSEQLATMDFDFPFDFDFDFEE